MMLTYISEYFMAINWDFKAVKKYGLGATKNESYSFIV